jgi:hypothetical protein
MMGAPHNRHETEKESAEHIELPVRLYISLVLTICAPLTGPALLTVSREYFDYYELASFLFLPALYFAFGCFIKSRRLSRFEKHMDDEAVRRAAGRHTLFYNVALILACMFQAFSVIALSPGGPQGLREKYWISAIFFYIPYCLLAYMADKSLNRARTLKRRIEHTPSPSAVQNAEGQL